MPRLLLYLYPCDVTDDLDDIDTAIATVQTTVDDIEAKVDTVDTTVDGIATDQASMQTDIDDIYTYVSATSIVVGSLTTALATVTTVVNAIKVVTDALAVLTETGGTLTTDGNEQNVYINNAPAGVYRPAIVKINTTNHTVTETIVIREYYRTETGGDYLKHDTFTYLGTIDKDEITVHLDPNRYGVKVTMQKTSGDNRDYVWEVFYEV